MDTELIRFADKFTNSVEKMANTTEKISKMMTKFYDEMEKCEKRSSKYFAKSGDQFKLATDITIPAKPESFLDSPNGDVDPDKRAEDVKDEVIKTGTIVTVNITVRNGSLVYQLVYKNPFVTVSGYELNELIEGGILEKV